MLHFAALGALALGRDMLLLYNTALLPVRAAAELWAAWKTRSAHPSVEWAERTARVLPRVAPGGAWIHGASVGEARIVRSLARELRRRRPPLPIAASCVTRTGRAQLPGAPEVDAAFFVPLDLPGFPGRVLDALAPSVLVLVETELWPNLLHEAARRRVPAVLVNGRLAPEKMARYRRFTALYRPMLASFARIGAQSEEESARFVSLGASKDAVVVTGNVKYDAAPPSVSAESLRERFGIAAQRPVVVAGSTGAGEDALVLQAFRRARARVPELFLVLAPRHPERFESAAAEIAQAGLELARTSAPNRSVPPSHGVLLVDTLGELAGLYRLASAAFVGGSLVPVGGHNLIEPAAAGAPVLFGPHTEHVAETAALLLSTGGARRVANASELAQAFGELATDRPLRESMAAAARSTIEANRGALARSADLVLAALAPAAERA